MAVKATKVQVWAGDIPDQPGGLDAVLSQLAAAGADLECVIARRQTEDGEQMYTEVEKPETVVLALTPPQPPGARPKVALSARTDIPAP